jgi:hypothetical protein
MYDYIEVMILHKFVLNQIIWILVTEGVRSSSQDSTDSELSALRPTSISMQIDGTFDHCQDWKPEFSLTAYRPQLSSFKNY